MPRQKLCITAAVITCTVTLAGCSSVSPAVGGSSSRPQTLASATPYRSTATVDPDGTVELPDTWRARVARAPVRAGIVPETSLSSGSDLVATLSGADGHQVSFGTGTVRFRNFRSADDTTYNGLAVPAEVSGIRGSGTTKTTFEMVPHTSTRADTIPTRFPDTNQLSLMRVVTSGATLSGFTLQATDQGHLYNGLRVQKVSGVHVSDVRVVGVPGDASSPPGETFGLNDFATNGDVYTRVEVDGEGVGASGFGANDDTNLTLRDCYFHDNPSSMGAAFWQSSNITIIDSIAANNGHAGFNFERVSGYVHLIRPVVANNGIADIRFSSDVGSANVTIVDPVYSGAKLRVVVPPAYNGKPNLQKHSAIHLIVHGVDRTKDLLEIVPR